jgi:hypothetical protein
MFKLSRQIINTITINKQTRKYWVPSVKPTYDIVNTIIECEKWKLSYPVKKTYSNHTSGDLINLDTKQLLSCKRFIEVKKYLENDNFIISIIKKNNNGLNTYCVTFDDFNKRVYIQI